MPGKVRETPLPCGRNGIKLTSQQLEALAVYRTHKKCQCENCQKAREALVHYDKHCWR